LTNPFKVIFVNKTLPLILMCILGCSTHTQESSINTYYNNDKLVSVQSIENGELNGLSREYYQSGALKHAINYKNNEINGLYHTYYPDAALWVDETYDKGNLIGRREYNDKGEIVRNESYD